MTNDERSPKLEWQNPTGRASRDTTEIQDARRALENVE